MPINVEYDQYSHYWSYRGIGKILPNCLCDFATGSKHFSSSFLALRYAEENDVIIANRGQFP